MVDIKISEKELKASMDKVKGLGDAVTPRQRKAMLRKAAVIIRNEARANVPISDRPTLIYDTPKLSGKLKAPKGQGRVKIKLDPGTLRDDINVKSFRRSPDLFVGIGTARKVTAFWGHWLEFGNSQIKGIGYMRRAVESKKGEAINQLIKDATRLFDRKIKELSKK